MTLNSAVAPIVSAVEFAPQVAVVIPIYNGAADLPDLLSCLERQTYPSTQVEYWLVDNNSTDATAEILQAFTADRARPNFHWLRETQIQSAYAARNTGIKATQTEILVFTDADCRPQPNWLLHLVQPFTDVKVGIVAGEVAALLGDTLLERYADRHATLSQKHTLAHSFCPYGQTANLAVRRQILEQVGLFRPYLTTGGDADLCWRILQYDWQIRFAEQAIVHHRHRSTLDDLCSQWRRYGRSNRYLHELHGVSLAKELTLRDWMYRWSRWLLKEVPIAFIKVNTWRTGISGWIDAMVDTPLNLICQQARAQGQRQAQLPPAAQEIDWDFHPVDSIAMAPPQSVQ
jgi:cellulose synthase/poly-beta-1,6-N-acetylglucosamine synthase-like glycosyltransferase